MLVCSCKEEDCPRRKVVDETLKQVYDEGFMDAAGQDHPAYPRKRVYRNPYDHA